ncbi:MAG TPA: hypothetical protein VF503_21505 [Sphingobium sp.]|uniref:hypothetical protein n=1 Tax=Sphingobium sp. TaxID=1912891 RepID=UPI002ED0F679
MSDLIERYRRWLMNTGFDGGENSPPINMIAAIEARDAEIARMRDALTLIEKAETEVFDEDDTEDWVMVSMDMDEASRIATIALLNCTCMEVFGENPDCVAHGVAALVPGGPSHG